jgi:large subunit ribosomal protein LP0
LIRVGDKVGSSECALLNKLEIKPFKWSLSVEGIYSEGSMLTKEIIFMTQSELMSKFFSGIRIVAALGLRVGIPNLATVPHSFANVFKKLLALSIQTDYTFEVSRRRILFLFYSGGLFFTCF